MPYRYKPNCSVCQLTRSDKTLQLRVYNAIYKRDDEDESLNDIREEYHITPTSMYNHAKKHVTEAPKHHIVINEKKIAQVKARAAKDLELSFEHDGVVPKQDYETAVDEVIAKGMEDMKSSGKHVSVNQLLAATKIKADYMSKRRGQDVEVIKTMYQSMENKDGKKEVRSAAKA